MKTLLRKTRNLNVRIRTLATAILIFFGMGFTSYGQVSSYTFAQTTGTYSSISGTNVGFGTGWDDPTVASLTIPFPFNFNGTFYSSCKVTGNGFITFGTTAPATNEYNPISSTVGYAGAVSAFGRDLINNGVDVTYTTSGTTPNRVFIVQWNNARRYSGSARNGNHNFQIRLSEATNIVQIVYNSATSTYATNIPVQIGLRGAANTDYNNRTSATNFSSTTAGGSNSATVITKNTAALNPTAGLTFTWTPPTASYRVYYYDMNIGSTNWCAGETRNVTVSLKNTGTATWTNSGPDINIGCKWNAETDHNVRVDANGLAPGATQTYTLAMTAPSTTGSNNLGFDVVNEGNCWFRNNPGTCGSGTSTMNPNAGTSPSTNGTGYLSSAITIKPVPSGVNAGSDVTICNGSSTSLSGTPVPTTTTLFSENFESCGEALLNPSTCNWQEYVVAGGGDSHSYWAISDNCALSGSKSLTLWDDWDGNFCDYDEDGTFTSPDIRFVAYNLTKIDATNYNNLKLNFKWRCYGEWSGSTFYDFGKVMWSTNGTTWNDFSPATKYYGQTTTQTVSNLDISALNGQQFYLGFYWENDGSAGGNPPMTVDDVSVTGTPAYTYAWTPAAGLSSTTIYNPVATPTATTTYTMGVTLNGCTVSDNVDVTVRPTPTASISGTTAVCQGASAPSITFTNPQTLPVTVTYKVNSGSNQTINITASSTATTTQATATPNTYAYTLVSVAYQAAPNCSNAISGTATITVNAKPVAPTSGGDKESCYRATVPNLAVTVGVGEVADWYTASSGGSSIKTGLSFNEAVDGSGPNPTPGTYTYYVEARNTTSGCVSATRTGISLVVRSVPVVSPTPAAVTVCPSDAVTLAANATPGAGASSITSYAWSSGLAGSVSGGVVNPTASTTYTVTATNNYNCTNSASAVVDVKSAAAYVVLPSSTVTTAVEQCTDGGWTYYANASTPDEWIFAIRKNGNTFTAEADVTILGSRSSVDNINTTKAGWEHGSYLMTRYWNASVLSGTIVTPVDLRFFYDPAEKTAALNARDAAWASYPSTTKTTFRWFKTVGVPFGTTQINAIDGNSFNAFSNITLTESASGTENGVTYAQFDGVTSFSGGTGGYGFSSSGTGLPVKLIEFTATAVENSYIRLDWSTALEINNAGFEVERSTNGSEFTKIGWVVGHDNATSTIAYSFDDKTAQPNIRYYYRLKQIDNGNVAFEYSKIVSAAVLGGKIAEESVVMYPNPANKNLSVVLDQFQGEVMVTVTNVLGEAIYSYTDNFQKNKTTITVPLEHVSDGYYFVTVRGPFSTITKKIVKASDK